MTTIYSLSSTRNNYQARATLSFSMAYDLQLVIARVYIGDELIRVKDNDVFHLPGF